MLHLSLSLHNLLLTTPALSAVGTYAILDQEAPAAQFVGDDSAADISTACAVEAERLQQQCLAAGVEFAMFSDPRTSKLGACAVVPMSQVDGTHLQPNTPSPSPPHTHCTTL